MRCERARGMSVDSKRMCNKLGASCEDGVPDLVGGAIRTEPTTNSLNGWSKVRVVKCRVVKVKLGWRTCRVCTIMNGTKMGNPGPKGT